MTLSLKHAFQSAVADSGDTSLVQPSNWNAEHTMTLGADVVVGRTSSAGAAEEIACTAFARSLLDDVDAGAARTTLGLGTMATQAAGDYLTAATAATTYQPITANLTSWIAISRASGFDAFAAAATSANLRTLIDDETGTGALVFATSPTLVTPALGTPSSVTLANATGLPVSTGISGLGTGIAAALAVNTGSAGAPVLLNGALGTPSSGTLTNVSGLPAATGLTGQVPVANGGTGAATATAGFDALAPTTTRGDLIRRGAANNERLSLGASGYALLSDGTDAAWSGFLQAGTGATTRTWQSKAREIFSVRDFGATGDGVTNDTAAIQAAIDASSGIVLISAGTYLVDSLTLKEGTFLVGEGQRATVLKARSNSIDVLKYLAATSIRTGFGITDLRIDSNSKTGCRAIRIDGNTTGIRCSQVHVHDLVIEGAFNAAISLKYCANSFIGQIFIASAVDGVQIDQCADTDIVSVKVQSGTGYGFYINGGGGAFDEGVRLMSCSTNGQAYGLAVNGQDWGLASGCSFTTTSAGGVVLTNATNWKFAACEFSPAASVSGATLNSGCSGITFASCQFSNGTFGIVAAGSNHTFTGNYFTANSNVDLYLDGSTYCNAKGNVLKSTGVAWSILEAGAANYNDVTGNTAVGLVTISGANSAAAAYYAGGTDVAVADGGTGASTARGGAANLGSWHILAASNVAVPVPNSALTTEQTYVTVTVPAGAMGANGRLRITTLWNYTNSVNNKTPRVRFGGAAGTAFLQYSTTTTATAKTITDIGNRNSVSSQVGNAAAVTGGIGATTGAIVTAAVDTSAAADIVITGQLASAGETLTLESYMVELYYKA